MQDYVGKQIDRYRITERLGMGGMAIVYKAYDTRLERDVAVKLIRTEEIPPSQHERLMLRFEREAKMMAKFDHPNIAHIYDFGEVDGSPYLVMAYIPGGTLKERTGKPIDVQTTIEWMLPIIDAVSYAHEQGVIHRDIKPSNILFDVSGKPVLTDFGIAKILETNEATLTGTGLGVGTPEYMAPEQWRGLATEASDQYALGTVLYELVTGEKPYTADTPVAVALMQMTEPLRSPRSLINRIPERLEKILFKTLARNPEDRYDTITSMKSALEDVISAGYADTQELSSPFIPGVPNFYTAEDRSKDETMDAYEYESSPQFTTMTPDGQPSEVKNKAETIAAAQKESIAPEPEPVIDHFQAENKSSKGKLPKWLLWGGIGIISLGLLGGILAIALGGLPFLSNNQATTMPPTPDWDAAYEYYGQLFDQIYAAGFYHVWSSSDDWTEEQHKAVWDRILDTAGEEVVNFVIFLNTNFREDYSEISTGFSPDEIEGNEGLEIMFAMVFWGFGYVEDSVFITPVSGITYDLINSFPTIYDFVFEILLIYGGDVQVAFSDLNSYLDVTSDETDVLAVARDAFIQEWISENFE